ncbi:uncharacterized protein LOC113217502 [Frankliniella occidentalis]|uniref:Uncharacterized protein LOC113217502 n=1 Tax=Frankliniella occidentalis TaxID=133901 RepID=A0A6J1TNK8_FRAOC|nr:uncharacterized protein LOC113217502 [Frankliniella occidentalis]
MAQEHIAALALEQAVGRFSRDEEQSDDILLVSVTNSVNVESMCPGPGDEVDVAYFQLNNPRITWGVKLLVADNGVLRVVLYDVSAKDRSRLHMRGTVHVRSRCSGEYDVDLQVDAKDHEPLRPRSPLRLRVAVDADGPATIASVHRATVSEIGVTMTTFYYHPKQGPAADEGRADSNSSEDATSEEVEVDTAAVNEGPDARLLNRLSADFGQLLTTQKEADITLVAEEQPVRAHRAILAARSPVFRRLLQRHRDRAEPLELEDAPHEAFLKVLDFMYTGDASGLQGLERDVLVLAGRFGVDDLADLCCRRLLRALRLDHSKALDMLAFAERHAVHRLKQSALLVAVEHLCEVTASQQWHDYKQSMPSLAADLLETAARVLRHSRRASFGPKMSVIGVKMYIVRDCNKIISRIPDTDEDYPGPVWFLIIYQYQCPMEGTHELLKYSVRSRSILNGV